MLRSMRVCQIVYKEVPIEVEKVCQSAYFLKLSAQVLWHW